MAATRKIQIDVERLLKKVQVSLEDFRSTWTKMEDSTDASKKDKLEGELKKEIKRLQRDRDQIRTWLSCQDAKTFMDNLESARKSIEIEMERFKQCEKVSKIKAFSKEGLILQPKVDAQEQAKSDAIQFLNKTFDSLQLHIDECEAEIESLTTGKSSKKASARISSLEAHILKHKWHRTKLEQVYRLMEKEQITPEEVVSLKESVEYYLDMHKDPDYVPDEGLYDELPFEKLDCKVGEELSIAVSGMRGVDITRKLTSLLAEKKGKKPEVKSSECIEKQALGKAEKPDVPANLEKILESSSEKKKLPPPDRRLILQDKRPLLSEIVSGGSPTATPENELIPVKSVSLQLSCPPALLPKNSESSRGILSTSSRGMLSLPPLIQRNDSEYPAKDDLIPGVEHSVKVPEAPTKSKEKSWGGVLKAKNISASPVKPGRPLGKTVTCKSDSLQSVSKPPSPKKEKASIEAKDTKRPAEVLPIPEPGVEPNQNLSQAPLKSVKSISSRQGSNFPITHGVLVDDVLIQDMPPPSKTKSFDSKASNASESLIQNKRLTDADFSEKTESPMLVAKHETGERESATKLVAWQPLERDLEMKINEFGEDKGNTLLEFPVSREILESRGSNSPDAESSEEFWRQQGEDFISPSDSVKKGNSMFSIWEKDGGDHSSETPRPTATYVSPSPCKVPESWPHVSVAPEHAPALMSKVGTEAQLFAFHFQKNTYLQYLAAKELKGKNWRFHKEQKMWFQRQNSPIEVTKDYERGNYVYFDHNWYPYGSQNQPSSSNGIGWLKRVKKDFVFRYEDLEDELR